MLLATTMAYALSFSERFFTGLEPLDEIKASETPTSVYEAIVGLRDDMWRELARDIFNADPAYLTVDEVFDRVGQTNTCTDLSPPVEVWIDEAGDYRLLIYESLRE